MKLDVVKEAAYEILKRENGYFISAYQICRKIESDYNDLWEEIVNEYSSPQDEIIMGSGSAKHYSPASFVAKALTHFSKKDDRIAHNYLSCKNVTFDGITPGYTGNVVGIWAWQGAY